MSSRVFYVTYVGEPILQIALDALRFIANPQAKGFAHITVRGPYYEQPELNLDVLSLEGKQVSISGVSDFFDSGQNTVFLDCHCEALAGRWDKPDFGFRPHITLYDGPSRPFARRLKGLLTRKPVNLYFRATGLARLLSHKGSASEVPRPCIDTAGLSWLLGVNKSIVEVQAATEQERLKLIETIWNGVIAHFADATGFPTVDLPRNAGLFSFEHLWAASRKPRSTPLSDLHELVTQAYLECHQGRSIDRVLADPDENVRFLSECWKLGAQASQYELNKALLNARKEGAIGRVPGVSRFRWPRLDLERCLFASEVALRLVQDEAEAEHGLYRSLDRILCEPTLSYRFEQFARSITPGLSSGAYRWAAIVLRKAQNRRTSGVDSRLPRFRSAGKLDDPSLSVVEPVRGLYRLRGGDADVYIGQSSNLRLEIERLACIRLNEIPFLHRAELFAKRESLFIEVAPCPADSSSRRDSFKARLVRSRNPSMNVLSPPKRAVSA